MMISTQNNDTAFPQRDFELTCSEHNIVLRKIPLKHFVDLNNTTIRTVLMHSAALYNTCPTDLSPSVQEFQQQLAQTSTLSPSALCDQNKHKQANQKSICWQDCGGRIVTSHCALAVVTVTVTVTVICAEFAWWADAGSIANHMSDVVLLEDTRQEVCAGSPREDGDVFTSMRLIGEVEW